MVKIKICGITNENEIDYLNELKPDYAGFVFAESKRKIDKDKAAILSSRLNDYINTVGVFRNQTISEITDILNKVSLNVIQLHGEEDIEYIRSLRNKINEINKVIEIWKAVSIDDIDKIKKFNNEIYEYKDNNNKLIMRKLIDKYLIDGVNPGSGQEYSLNTLDYIPEEAKFFLAGGINPNNIKEKINAVHPFGIDVSSGVEYIDEHGLRKKSYEKIKLLIENAKK